MPKKPGAVHSDPTAFDVVATATNGAISGWIVTHVADPYGQTVLNRTDPISIVSGATHVQEIPFTPTSRGIFSVSTWVTGPSTFDVIFTSQTSIGVIPSPANPGFDDESAIGYYVSPFGSEASNAILASDVAKQLQDLGVKWARLGHSEWAADTRTTRPDTSNASWLDTASFNTWVDALRARGVQVSAQLSGSARWASTQPDDTTDTGWGAYWSLSTPIISDWQLYVTTMANRFAGRIHHWDIWNEPDSKTFYEPRLTLPSERTIAGQRYAQLVQAAATALATADPNNKLIVNLTEGMSRILLNG